MYIHLTVAIEYSMGRRRESKGNCWVEYRNEMYIQPKNSQRLFFNFSDLIQKKFVGSKFHTSSWFDF